MAEIILTENSIVPSTPPSGTVTIYCKEDGQVYSKDDAGNEVLLGSAGVTLDTVLNTASLRP